VGVQSEFESTLPRQSTFGRYLVRTLWAILAGTHVSCLSCVTFVSDSQSDMSLGFRLADGRRWVIRPYDEEAAAIVAELGRSCA